jgi:Fe-S-cluster-containing dehydrogenase component
MNPDVTVRARGVMEKCTYCVQRIREAEIREKVQERPLRDGDVRTACEEACPAGAIVFGDIEDHASRVAGLRADPRAYGALDDLGVQPRTQYLARLRNPNPELA